MADRSATWSAAWHGISVPRRYGWPSHRLSAADLTPAIIPIDEAPRAFELLRAAGTMKVLVAPIG